MVGGGLVKYTSCDGLIHYGLSVKIQITRPGRGMMYDGEISYNRAQGHGCVDLPIICMNTFFFQICYQHARTYPPTIGEMSDALVTTYLHTSEIKNTKKTPEYTQ